MTEIRKLGFLPLNRLRVAVAGIILLAVAISIAVLSVDVMRQIDKESESRTDNAQWALSQLELELMQLILALDDARNGAGSLDDVRLRYDVLFSRVAILRDGKVFAGLRDQPGYTQSIAQISDFMQAQLALIDGPDQALRTNLAAFSSDARRITEQTRSIALSAVRVIAVASDRKRADIARTLILTGLMSATLVALLVGLLILLMQLYRDNRRTAAENLETLSRLDKIVATAMEAIITSDSRGRIVDFNAAACATLGFSRDEVVGTDLADLVTPSPDATTHFLKGKPPEIRASRRLRVVARRKEGDDFPAEMAISRTGDGDHTLFVAFLRDLSGQLAAEQALTLARDEALAGEKAKADLLVVMSHEIRTPLNGMIGTIELLDTTDLQPHQREYLRIMAASGRLLMHHVNDVLDIARLDSGRAPFTPTPIDLVALVQEVMENQGPASQANGNTMRFCGPTDGRSLVECDGAQLRQILLNLLGNAVKFTQNGHIAVEIRHLSDTGPTEISISDTGIGIPKADLDRIFDDFVTLDVSYARRASGTGLGLGIVKRLVGRMDGNLTVESEEGRGSTFRIHLPLPILGVPPQIAENHRRITENASPLVVLVVEDNDFNRLIVREMLLKEGHEVHEAHDGEEGIAMAAAQRFDLILMDISMPRIDGLQAAAAIQAGGGASAHAPIAAMTAHALADEVARFRAGGMAQVLVKPITRDALRTVLAGLPLLQPGQTGPIDRVILMSLGQDLGAKRAGELVKRFMAETRDIVARIATGLVSAAPDQALIRDLHRLQGSAAMFGARALQTHLATIETAWKLGSTQDAETLLADLQRVWHATEHSFQEFEGFPQPSSLR